MAEETGELNDALITAVYGMLITKGMGKVAHAILKHQQGIRGYDDIEKVRAEVGDAIADIMVYAINLLTTMRLDMGVLFSRTACEVMKRDWVANPLDAADKVG